MARRSGHGPGRTRDPRTTRPNATARPQTGRGRDRRAKSAIARNKSEPSAVSGIAMSTFRSGSRILLPAVILVLVAAVLVFDVLPAVLAAAARTAS